jgi:hypothetical protein
MHTALAVVLVKNRLSNAQAEDFDTELHELGVYEEYLDWMRADIKEASKGAKIAFWSGVLTWALWLMAGWQAFGWTAPTWLSVLGDWVFFGLAVPPAFFIIVSTRDASRQLRALDMTISNAIRTRSAKKAAP